MIVLLHSVMQNFLNNKINHEEYDEFSSFDAGESATFTIDPNKNIDPVFRVNLDLHTQGSSILFVLARQAVKFHRFWVVSLPSFLFSQFRVIYILSTLPYSEIGASL